MQNKKKVLFWIFLVIGMGCVAFLIGWTVSQKQREQVYEEIQKEAVSEEPAAEVPEDTEVPTPEPTEEPVEIPIDFAKLQESNEDIYAWIQIPDTVVDYPIVQHPMDDSYYLNHTIEGKSGLPGSIYTESWNHRDFTDPNTVIYGHNMKNGSMFGDLSLYKDVDYLNEHKEIFIYTPEHIYTYEVFAQITYDNRHILNWFDFSSDTGLLEFIDSLKESRNMSNYIDDSITITSTDRIIVLSTCNGNSEQRYLIGAVLVDEQ